MGLWDGKKRVFLSVGGQGMALSASWGSFWGQNRVKLMVRGQIKGPERVLNRQKGCLGQSAASLGSDQELKSSESVHFDPSEALLRTLRPSLTTWSRKNSPTSATWTISGPFWGIFTVPEPFPQFPNRFYTSGAVFTLPRAISTLPEPSAHFPSPNWSKVAPDNCTAVCPNS
jgi:hypothetical protein